MLDNVDVEQRPCDQPDDGVVPAARALDNFSATEIGQGEIVLFDNERLTYHTLNRPAFDIWQLCDGQRTYFDIVTASSQLETQLPFESVALAVSDLAEAGLLRSPLPATHSIVSRRSLFKAAAAGAIGVVVLPTVNSITSGVSADHISGCIGHCTLPQICCSEEISCGTGNDQCKFPLGSECNGHGQCCSNNCVAKKCVTSCA